MNEDGTYENEDEYRQELRKRLALGEAVYGNEVVPLLDKIDAMKKAIGTAILTLAKISNAYDQRTTDWARVTARKGLEGMKHDVSAAVDLHSDVD